MRTVPLTLTLALALLTATPTAASYLGGLPTGRIKVDVMKAVTAPQSIERTARLQAIVTTEPERWQVSSQGVPEEREPWEQRLALSDSRNLTHEEQAERPNELILEKTGEAVIEIVPTGDGRMMLQADDSLPELSGIILDVVRDSVETPFGRTTQTTEVTSHADRFAPDAWSGTQWQLDAPGELPGAGTSIKFAIGRLADNRVIVNYQAMQVEDGKMPRRANYVIVFSAN